MSQTVQQLREFDMEELLLRAAELQKDMFDVRMRLVTKEQNNTAVLRDKRRAYARLLTIIREKQTAAAK